MIIKDLVNLLRDNADDTYVLVDQQGVPFGDTIRETANMLEQQEAENKKLHCKLAEDVSCASLQKNTKSGEILE